MASVNDLNAEYQQMLDNRGLYGDRAAYYDNIKTQLDLHAYAVANGFKPVPYKEGRDPGDNDANIPAAIEYLKSKGLYDQAVAQSGILNGAKYRGFTGTDPTEALGFLESYNDAYNAARQAGYQVQEGMTFEELTQLVQGDEGKAFNNQAAINGSAGGNGGSSAGSSGAVSGTSTGGSTQANQMTDQQFNDWLNQQNLSADQKAALKAVYDSVSVNDVAKAQQVTEAMAAAAQYSDPYFKAQISLVTDALARGLASDQGDLQFQTQSLQRSLQALRDDIAASKDYLSFQNRQELEALARKYELDIENNTNAMAATGFTQSSRRARTEGFISDAYGNAVESSNRSLAYQTGRLNRQLSTSQADTAAQIANLQRLVQEGKIDALRKAEEQVGTTNLQSLGYTGLLGNVGGEIPRQQVQDMTNFAGAFAF